MMTHDDEAYQSYDITWTFEWCVTMLHDGSSPDAYQIGVLATVADSWPCWMLHGHARRKREALSVLHYKRKGGGEGRKRGRREGRKKGREKATKRGRKDKRKEERKEDFQ